MLCIRVKNNINGRHSSESGNPDAVTACLPAGRQKRGTFKMNWIPVSTGNTGFRIPHFREDRRVRNDRRVPEQFRKLIPRSSAEG